ncbi:MAG: ExbD/TolR family protein [Gammaproteobacteria bacterium]|nr:ExbD/TolR family protein [Gammaproteobacteria bacterium]
MSEINVVPYIDVMLVLLIIFMVTAPLLTVGVQVDLPKGTANPIPEVYEFVVISVDVNGDYFFETQTVPTSSEELKRRIKVLRERNPDLLFLVRADGQTNYQDGVIVQHVVDLMILLQESGVDSVSLAIDPTGT